MVVQLCFQIKDKEHNNYVISKLKELKSSLDANVTVASCHLPRKIVKEKGFATDIVDAFDEIFGQQYVCYVKGDTFAEVMCNIDQSRTELAKASDRIIVIGEQLISNIALEVEMFTQSKVVFI